MKSSAMLNALFFIIALICFNPVTGQENFTIEITIENGTIINITDVEQNNSTNNTTPPTPPIDEGNGPAWLKNSSVQLSRFMLDDYNYFVTPKGNKIWACAMSLAWNELKQSFLSGKNAEFKDTNELQNKIVSNLNSELFTRDQLSPQSYYVTSGYGQSTVDRINFQVNRKFPNRTMDNLTLTLQDESFISFAYLYKNLQFPVPFEQKDFFNFNGQSVTAFQARYAKQKMQVYYKYYNAYNDFLLGLNTKNPNEEILLLKSPYEEMKNMKVSKVLELVHLYDKIPKNKLKSYDQFAMPDLKFDYVRTYQELINVQFLNEEVKGYRLSGMLQRLKLKLTKQGVVVQNEAEMIVYSVWGAKRFFLDSDFWLILKEVGKKPYLIIAVSNVNEQWKA